MRSSETRVIARREGTTLRRMDAYEYVNEILELDNRKVSYRFAITTNCTRIRYAEPIEKNVRIFSTDPFIIHGPISETLVDERARTDA